jgi:aspartate-semialdehyde dehydrogenase
MASQRSAGRTLKALGREIVVEDLASADPGNLDVVFFSAGAERSRAFAPAFTEAGVCVIDNSSAFRRDLRVPLVVPEINGRVLEKSTSRLIANPNCSTIIALFPLAALHRKIGLERVLLSTYQAVSGAGDRALHELLDQTRGVGEGEAPIHRVLPRPILFNVIPWIGALDDSGFCEEETKIAYEGRRILGLPSLKISATTVRVPVRRCHSIALWARFSKPVDLEEVKAALADSPGLTLSDPPPCPAELEGTDDVHVGRIRMDPDEAEACWMWVVADQLRRGAALNALLIAEKLHALGKLSRTPVS